MFETPAPRFESITDAEIARLSTESAQLDASIARADAAAAKIDAYTAADRAFYSNWATEALRSWAAGESGRRRRAPLAKALAAVEAKYTGWTRYFFAQSHDGHIHSSTNCSTCNRGESATSFYWLTDFSGLPETELVELAGERACTTCFSWAPVDTLKRASRIDVRTDEERAAQAERAAEKAARTSAKQAKALRLDLEPVRITATTSKYYEHLKTIVSARNFYVGQLAQAESVRVHSNEGGRNDDLIADYIQQAEQALVALAARDEVDVETKRAELAPNVARKIKKDQAESAKFAKQFAASGNGNW